MSVLAERAFTSCSPLQRIENGDPAVSMRIYAAVRNVLGLLEGADVGGRGAAEARTYPQGGQKGLGASPFVDIENGREAIGRLKDIRSKG